MNKSVYFERYATPQRYIEEPIRSDCKLSVVIPVFNEPDLLLSLQSLYKCNKPKATVEIILVVNHAEDSPRDIINQNDKTVAEITSFTERQTPIWLSTHVIKAYHLPKKKAGVGLARKIGMDEAAFRFHSINTDGIIICFDADSLCQANYLTAIEESFFQHYNVNGASIHFEHPLYFESGALNWPIIHYELHLRYYIQALAFAGYPHAFHTIGSSMAVLASTYQKQGGMNTRKAGEDFYFLHKIIPLGQYINITNTVVTPSARESDRVPFGTGIAIKLHNREDKLLGFTYNFNIFIVLKTFFDGLDRNELNKSSPKEIIQFLHDSKLKNEYENLAAQATNNTIFKARFFQWFNGFKVLKCVHYLRDNYYAEPK